MTAYPCRQPKREVCLTFRFPFTLCSLLSLRQGQADPADDCVGRDASSPTAQKQDGFHRTEQDGMLHFDPQHYPG